MISNAQVDTSEPMPHPENSAETVILTALNLEHQAVIRHLPNGEETTVGGSVYYRSALPKKDGTKAKIVALCLGAMGNVAAAAGLSRAISVWNPANVLVAGIAGGVRAPQRTLGDLVVATQIVSYDQGKETSVGFQPRFDVLRSSFPLLQQAQSLPGDWTRQIQIARPDHSIASPSVHFGVVASGGKVIADESTVPQIQQHWRQLIAIEMEAYGAALAAWQQTVASRFLLAKAICDWADSSKNDDWQPYAAEVSASFVTALASEIPTAPSDRPQAQKLVPPKISYSGKNKIRLCERLGDNWQDLADYFDIPDHERRRFDRGRECQAIWEWLKARGKLEGLEDALDFIGRDDLKSTLEPL